MPLGLSALKMVLVMRLLIPLKACACRKELQWRISHPCIMHCQEQWQGASGPTLHVCNSKSARRFCTWIRELRRLAIISTQTAH